jgi:Kef-type K+ transport system membrane component KefB
MNATTSSGELLTNLLPLAAAGAGHDSGAVPTILLMLAFVLVAAKLAGDVLERLGQPAVLGELLVGIALGSAVLFGGPDTAGLVSNETFTVLAELGAVLLLFHVGLESTPREMLAVGGPAARVAIVGVVTPMLLGFAVGELARPDESWMLHAFLGAMLSATSVGITARVLKDVDALRSGFARIILGAAVIDDVLGLLVLAVVSGIIKAAVTGDALSAGAIVMIIVKAFLFLVGALFIGSYLSPRLFRGALALRSRGIVLSLSLGLCFLLSYLALRAGLAPIVGAFAAGLVLEEVHFEGQVQRGEPPLHESLEPLIALLVPVFFVRMGMLVDVRSFASASVLGFAALLTVAAILGKLACAFATPKGMSGLTVGLGMMPRGEVGLIFAGIGAQLTLGGHPVIDAGTYAAAVFMVVATTMATPPLLLWSMRRSPSAPA